MLSFGSSRKMSGGTRITVFSVSLVSFASFSIRAVVGLKSSIRLEDFSLVTRSKVFCSSGERVFGDGDGFGMEMVSPDFSCESVWMSLANSHEEEALNF